MYGLGLTWRSDPVQVERLGPEVEVEALRQHDLEDVAGQDVLLGHLDGLRVAASAGCGAVTSGSSSSRSGGIDQRLVEGPAPVGGQLVEPARAPS